MYRQPARETNVFFFLSGLSQCHSKAVTVGARDPKLTSATTHVLLFFWTNLVFISDKSLIQHIAGYRSAIDLRAAGRRALEWIPTQGK